MIRWFLPVFIIHWYARMPRPDGGYCILAAGATLTSAGCPRRNPKPCWTNCGLMPRGTRSPGAMNGWLATWSYGTTVAPCTGAIRSTRSHAAFCTARRSKARRRVPSEQAPREQDLDQCPPGGSLAAMRDVPDPVCRPREHFHGRASDEAGPGDQQHATGARLLGFRNSLRAVSAHRRLDRR